METTKFKTVDEYIAALPDSVKPIIEELRETVKQAAPEAEESISYNMPAYQLNGPLAYYAAFKNHIGFYPTPASIIAFEEELSAYKGAKGSIQFPLNKPLPLELITRIVKVRLQENLNKNKPTKKDKKVS
jgi:uncharacterized protein YdhG (YjbR/CyaY superfamily)